MVTILIAYTCTTTYTCKEITLPALLTMWIQYRVINILITSAISYINTASLRSKA